MKVLVPLANGFEDIEAFAVIDVLRRAGIEVDTVGIPSSMVTSKCGVRVIADKSLREVKAEEYDGIILPGGNPGYKNLEKSREIIDIIKKMDEAKKLIAAICGSTSILAKIGLLDDKKATIYPGMEKFIPHPRDERVVVDKNVITSQGPGTAIEFSLKIVEYFCGKEKALALKKALVVWMNIEEKILREVSRRHVLRKVEIKNFLKKEDEKKVEKVIKKLIDKGLIVNVPFIESCIAITQKGMRELKK